ncbi:hypothetical protein C7G42_33455 [Bradyrhizobium sp. MOS003]|nr:hypothetical protein C7G42_33455 [Bradyrhizobium sp. MOS003]
MHFVMVKTGGRKFRCIKCDDIDPMQVPTFKHGRTAKNCVNRRDIGLGWVGGLAAFIVLEACLLAVDWLVPSTEDALGGSVLPPVGGAVATAVTRASDLDGPQTARFILAPRRNC